MSPKPTVREDGGDVTIEQLDQKGQVKTITHDEVKKWMNTKTGQFVIVDVRTQEEFNQGHLPGAILVTVTELATPKGQALLPKNLDMPIVVYCRSGNRSSDAAKKLTEMGYKQVYDLGGITGWEPEKDK